MTEHLKKSAEQYSLIFESSVDSDMSMHPISRIDGEIITEIRELFKKAGMTAVAEILKNYKFREDLEIRDSLLEINTYYHDKVEKDGDAGIIPNKIRYWLVNDRRIDLFCVYSYDVLNIMVGDKMTYLIVLNPTPQNAKKIPVYANDQLIFMGQKERDEKAEMLDAYFQEFRGGFIQNKI